MREGHLNVTGLAGHATVTVVACIDGQHYPVASLMLAPERVAQLAAEFAAIATGDDPDLPIPFELVRPKRQVRVYQMDDLWTFDCRDHPVLQTWHDHPEALAAANTHVRNHHQEQPA